MCILDLHKILMYEFHYDFIENKYGSNSRILFTGTDSFLYEIKTEEVCEDFSKDKEMFDFSSYSAERKLYDSNKLIVGKIKDQTGGVAIKEFFRLNLKMYSFLVNISSKHKKETGVNQNVAEKISHCKYKDFLLNKT